MNPLSAREQITLSEDHPLPNPPQGIPGLISGDAIVQAYVNLMQDQCDRKNANIQGIYANLLQQWRDNNARGVFNPAPGPMELVHLNQAAAANYERTGVGSALMFSFYDQWDPTVPPGTIASPPPQPIPPAKTAESIGDRIPGTSNLYAALGGPYDASEVGTEQTVAGAKYQLINMSPMTFEPAWMKEG